MKPAVLIVLSALLLAVPLADCSTQSIAVHGWLRCKNEYVGNVPVRLFDKDTVDPDDLLSETRTSTGGQSGPVGYFNISGSGAELTETRPRASDHSQLHSYLTDGSATPAKSYNAEVLTLEDKENDC
ncbi:hypothetical protein M3Y99_01291900 [Aphelenchoides fujianensis]|nr:hypothetical protein M3Y99_01291900 [Aphelenchoides fujianensis]